MSIKHGWWCVVCKPNLRPACFTHHHRKGENVKTPALTPYVTQTCTSLFVTPLRKHASRGHDHDHDALHVMALGFPASSSSSASSSFSLRNKQEAKPLRPRSVAENPCRNFQKPHLKYTAGQDLLSCRFQDAELPRGRRTSKHRERSKLSF